MTAAEIPALAADNAPVTAPKNPFSAPRIAPFANRYPKPDIGTVAPMVGLLGTVLGMMETFWQMASGNFEGVKQMQMAGGISEALITTAGGLMLAIPCMLAYVIFRNYIQKHISDMEVAVTHVLSVIASQSERDSRLGSISHVGARPEMMDGDEI